MRILIINGPNLNLLGTREPETYGTDTLDSLGRQWRGHAVRIGVSVTTFQSNHEGAIIDAIHGASGRVDGIVLNPGALSHYSYAIYDALIAVGLPTVEIHISNIYERETWRHTSVTGAAAIGMIYGRGPNGYIDAINMLVAHLTMEPLTVNYGEGRDAIVDLRVPDAPTPPPVAVLVHGGFWREIWKRDVMEPMAVALTRRGWATANVEYTRGPGSFPASSRDVAQAIEWVVGNANDRGMDAAKIVVIGHSAGGYLALKAATAPDAVVATFALAPVTDLRALSSARPVDDPVEAFLGASLDTNPHLWEEASLPARTHHDVHLIHGTADDAVPESQTTSYVSSHPDESKAHLLAGSSHMALIDPQDPAFNTLTSLLEEITRR